MLSEYNHKSRRRPRSAQSPRLYGVYTYNCEQLTNENTLLKEELKETKRMYDSRNEYSPTEIHKRIQSITEEYQKQKDIIKHQNAGIVAPWKLDSQYSFPAERDDMEMRKRIDYLEKENKRLQLKTEKMPSFFEERIV
uniref:Uncharacterized protein n=1 Tax=Magallana gigas TaxID=29159 RepID=K1P4Y6_MAGGI